MDIQTVISKIISFFVQAGVFLGTISILVILHEWGHFIIARLAGVRVHEFSMGMGKKLFGRKWGKGDTEYQFRLIPIGGYIRMAGEQIEPDSNVKEFKKDEFYGVSAYRRLAIVLGGAGYEFYSGGPCGLGRFLPD